VIEIPTDLGGYLVDNYHILIVLNAAKEAGKLILNYFGTSISSQKKSDGSPLTMADQESHRVITAALEPTGIPVVSEEGEDLLMNESKYWLVDPLDGTKEFLLNNEEFTINIALIEENKPVFGLMYAPAIDEMYIGIPGKEAWMERNGIRTKCTIYPERNKLFMATSRFHDHSGSDIFAADNGIGGKIALGSALKYGRIAIGEVDVYLRLIGTSEWDTAAGQAILEAAGGSMIDLNTGLSMIYGKAKRRNGGFIAFRAPYKYTDFKINKL
jgi:3'(2'), 5'-bisphosphate nucleotidase